MRRFLTSAAILTAALAHAFKTQILPFAAACDPCVMIETVIVGNPGNAGDVQLDGTFAAAQLHVGLRRRWRRRPR